MISVDDQAANADDTQEGVTFMTQLTTNANQDGAVIESGEGSLTLRIQK